MRIIDRYRNLDDSESFSRRVVVDVILSLITVEPWLIQIYVRIVEHRKHIRSKSACNVGESRAQQCTRNSTVRGNRSASECGKVERASPSKKSTALNVISFTTENWIDDPG